MLRPNRRLLRNAHRSPAMMGVPAVLTCALAHGRLQLTPLRGHKIGAILNARFSSTIISIYRCGATEAQHVGPPFTTTIFETLLMMRLSTQWLIPDCYRYLFERSASASKWVQAGRLRAFHLWFSPNCGAFDCRFRLFCSRPEDTGNS
jgi:hypothetical protein